MAEENHRIISDTREACCQEEDRERADRQRESKSEGEVCGVGGFYDEVTGDTRGKEKVVYSIKSQTKINSDVNLH